MWARNPGFGLIQLNCSVVVRNTPFQRYHLTMYVIVVYEEMYRSVTGGNSTVNY